MVNDQTQITQSKTAKVTDLAVGERITVIPENADTAAASSNQPITARIIQAGDAQNFFGGQGRQGGQQSGGSGQ
ncbi:MAG: hypothetical protein EXR62_05600 [Chloroflexi bacterium]|nr:hypothetical protein [Chloroflexota bacterium]